jgi:hypothetical protein
MRCAAVRNADAEGGGSEAVEKEDQCLRPISGDYYVSLCVYTIANWNSADHILDRRARRSASHWSERKGQPAPQGGVYGGPPPQGCPLPALKPRHGLHRKAADPSPAPPAFYQPGDYYDARASQGHKTSRARMGLRRAAGLDHKLYVGAGI